MKKLILIFFLMMIFSPASLLSQAKKDLPREFPQEKLFIHFNTPLLLSGEYLYYQVYVLNSETQVPDDLSKIAYIELIAEDGSRVFTHKIRLEKGIGYADFFLPTSVPSGNYKLVGFTQWMKNGGEDNFFKADLAIINPYRGNQTGITSNSRQASEAEDKAADWGNREPEAKFQVSLETDKERFKKREKVNLAIHFPENGVAGNFSLSVRKMDGIQNPPKHTAVTFSAEKYSTKLRETPQFLPELRGEIISGKITAKESVPVENKMLALSIPGENFVFEVGSTAENGQFWFNISEDFSGETGFIEVLEEENHLYEFKMDPLPAVDASLLEFHNFSIDSTAKAEILARSIHNQVENAYYEVKPDTLKPREVVQFFYGKNPEWFFLDEYTRFPTLKETFVEIVNKAYTSKNRKGETVFKVRGLEGAQDFKLPTLLIVDGIMEQDHAAFLSYPAENIERIGILRENFYIGPQIFQGIILVNTFEGDYAENLNKDYIYQTELEKPQPEKAYFQPLYNDTSVGNFSRIPDFRYQLLWLPELKLEKAVEEIRFSTSDVSGEFEISLEGFTNEGKPVSLKKVFVVE